MKRLCAPITKSPLNLIVEHIRIKPVGWKPENKKDSENFSFSLLKLISSTTPLNYCPLNVPFLRSILQLSVRIWILRFST